MARTDEGKIKVMVKGMLKDIGAYFYLPVSNGMGVHGIPDFVGCYQGRFFGIETKVPGKNPTALQQIQIDKIREAQGFAFVCRTAEDVDHIRRTLCGGEF